MDGLLNHLPVCGKKFQESFPFQQKQNTKVKDAFSANSRMLAFRLTCKITQRWGCSDRYKGGFIYPVPRGPLSHNPSMVFYLSKEEERKEDVNNAGFKILKNSGLQNVLWRMRCIQHILLGLKDTHNQSFPKWYEVASQWGKSSQLGGSKGYFYLFIDTFTVRFIKTCRSDGQCIVLLET